MSNQAKNSPVAVVSGDLNMLRCFAGRGISTVVVSSDENEPTLRSRYCQRKRVIAAPADRERALSDLESIGRGYSRRPVLFYASDDMLQLISKNRQRLDRYFDFLMPPAELVEDLLDKGRFSSLAERTGLPVPKTLACNATTPAKQALAEMGLPSVFKPNTHIGWFKSGASTDGKPRKALVARTAEDFVALHEHVQAHAPSFLVQRYVGGGEERIYSYHAYLDRDSQPLGEFAGKKIRTYPMEAGVSTYLELVKEPAVLELGRSISETLGLVGAVKLDFKRDPVDESFHLLEINPRFTLWSYLGAACGINLPVIAYAERVGQEPKHCNDYRTGVRWLSFGNDFRAFLRDYGPRGELSVADWLLSYRGDTIYDVFSWRDPLPLGTCLFNYGKAVAERLRRSPRAA
jgi:predicted ATP-grasp superfamily ATP-dependent carboligase